MPNVQKETIEIGVVNTGEKPPAEANAQMAGVEASANKASAAMDKAVEGAGQFSVTITQRTQKQIDSIVERTERRLLTLKSPIERLNIEEKIKLRQVGGDPAAVQRISATFKE